MRPRSRFPRTWCALLILFVLAFAKRADAMSVTLAWDANTETNIAGYKIYYGTASRTYTNTIDVGNVTSYSVAGLNGGYRYYFAVAAYNSSGQSSPLSAEVYADVPLTAARIAIVPGTVTLASGTSSTLTARAYDEVGNILPGITFTWATSNPAVASLSATTGSSVTMSGASAGSATVTIFGGGQVATAAVVVTTTVARIAVTPSSASVRVGATTTLTATAYDASNNVIAAPVTWSSANSATATVSPTTGATTTVTGAAVGTTSIMASSGSQTASASITVTAAPAVNRVVVTPSSVNLVTQQTQQFSAVAYDSTNAPIQGVQFTWTTSNSSAAPLGATSGATTSVVAGATGFATVTAIAATNGVAGAASVTVTAPAITRVVLSAAASPMTVGWTQSLTVAAYDGSGNLLPAAPITWSSSNPQVLSVVPNGTGGAQLRAMSVGSATITAVANGGAQASTTVQVVLADTLLWDTFTGPDGLSVASHAPDVNVTGSAWTLTGGSAVLASNKARAVAQANPSAVAFVTVASPSADVRLAADWLPQGPTPWSGFVFRWADADNFLWAGYSAMATELAVYRVQRGSWLRLVTMPMALTVGSIHQLEVVASGPSIKVYWDGVLALQTSDTYNQTVLRHGLSWAPGVDAVSSYDTFRLTGVAGSAPAPSPSPSPSPSPTGGGGSGSGGGSGGSAPSAPSAPVVTSSTTPSTGEQPEPLRPTSMRSTVLGTTVQLQWTPPTSFVPVSYIVEAGSVSGASDLAYFEMPATAAGYTAADVPAGVYFVRVRARSADGQISAATNETIVRVGISVPVCSTSVTAPSGLSIVVDGSTVTLTWGASAGASSYVLEAGSAPGLTNLANFDTQSTAVGYTAFGVGAGTYHVRVRAKNGCGATSGPSNEVVIDVGR